MAGKLSDYVLYRKYRSGSFDEVIGQPHITRTLMAAISNDKISHAYLFTGPRGVGKTSIARLLARAVNCTDGKVKPCNACPSCQQIINSSMDIIEIDAASNRSIDSIRELKDKISLAPTQSKYKVYIIDEVHMLTTEAFNALLKTLEEPPAHAIFILATTEAQKLPETIISRTQRFNFHPIKEQDIVLHLAQIAQKEQITIDEPSLGLIASTARGGFRDAISLLDQLGSTGEPITLASARSLLGFGDAESLTKLSKAIATGNTAVALGVLQELEATGVQPGQLALQLSELWRQIMLAAAGAGDASQTEARRLAEHIRPGRAAAVVETLLEASRSHWPGLALETAIVKLTAQPEPTSRSRIAASAPAPTKAAAPSSTAAEPAPTTTGNLEAALWPKVLVLLKSQNNSLCALLQMYPVDFGDGELTILPRFNFHRDLFLKPANRSQIEAAAAKVYGRNIKVNARTAEAGAKPAKRSADPSAELVSSALEILGGEVVE